jgi:hypothetical protein
MMPQRNILMALWLGALVVLVGLLAVLAVQKYATQQPAEDGFATWQTYRNEEYGFEFKYPPEFGEIEKKEESCFIEGKYVQEFQGRPCRHITLSFSQLGEEGGTVFMGARSTLFRDYALGRGAYFGDFAPDSMAAVQEYCSTGDDEMYCKLQRNPANIIFAKSEEEKFSLEGEGKAFYYSLYNDRLEAGIVMSNERFEGLMPYEESERLFDQILSTFKFINFDPTANWQTYQNEEFGYEVKYPEGWTVDGPENNKYFAHPDDRALLEENRRICRGEQEGMCGPDLLVPSFSILVQQNTPDRTLEDIASALTQDLLAEDIQEIDSSGTAGLRIRALGLGSGLYAFFIKDDYLYTVTDEGYEVEPDFDQILSTFKFIEKEGEAAISEKRLITSFVDSAGATRRIFSQEESIRSNLPITHLWLDNTLLDSIELSEVTSPAISNNQGAKYLIFELLSVSGQDFLLIDEAGTKIEVDLSQMGLGTTIEPQYGLRFGNWIGATTTFTIEASSANGNDYEATFDAMTGKQIGETRQTN